MFKCGEFLLICPVLPILPMETTLCDPCKVQASGELKLFVAPMRLVHPERGIPDCSTSMATRFAWAVAPGSSQYVSAGCEAEEAGEACYSSQAPAPHGDGIIS